MNSKASRERQNLPVGIVVEKAMNQPRRARLFFSVLRK
jgi:hypothetical protein